MRTERKKEATGFREASLGIPINQWVKVLGGERKVVLNLQSNDGARCQSPGGRPPLQGKAALKNKVRGVVKAWFSPRLK